MRRRLLALLAVTASLCMTGHAGAQLPCTGTVFNDVDNFTQPLFCGWIERFFRLGTTAGCQAEDPAIPGNQAMYCPDDAVTRGQMAVFVTRALDQFAIIVRTAEDLQQVRALLSAGGARASNTIVYVMPGTYILQDTFHVNRSNVSLIARPGAKLVLADHVNKPVVSIGSQEETPTYTLENIYVSGLEIDGNKENQDSEVQADKNWIRNNGIDVRAVRRLTIENIVSGNNRSGGLVISNKSSDIHVLNSAFTGNFFDGVAYYDSTRIYTVNSSMRLNESAGISLDLDVVNTIFSNCILDSNHDVGIFARFAKEVRLNGCTIENSKSWAVFLGHDDNNRGVQDIMFSGCQFLNNNGGVLMSSVSEAQSSFNSIVGSVFRSNKGQGRPDIESLGSQLWQSGNIMMD